MVDASACARNEQSGGRYLVALDQGTTSSRAILYRPDGHQERSASRDLACRFPQSGWVEQDPIELWEGQLDCLKEVAAGVEGRIAAIGITNQRETIVCWDRASGKPLAPAIVWQCRRSAEICRKLREEGWDEEVRARTGLLIDSYFSASKIMWLLEHHAGVADAVRTGRAAFGTVDSWLLYNLTRSDGGVHATEPSNASRTMLYNIHTRAWDPRLLERCGIGAEHLPAVRPSCGVFGTTRLGTATVPITGALGDQQASLFGQGCMRPGEAKCTFGTGAFLLLNTGTEPKTAEPGILSTVAWQVGEQFTYAIEGSIFIAGAVVQWLRDNLGIIATSADCDARASRVPDSGGLVFVPAFVGLGAPYWDEQARGIIIGLSRATTADHIARAALEAVAHQVADLIEQPSFSSLSELRIDGGMSASVVFAEILSRLTGKPVAPAPAREMTAFGAARIAALGAGIFSNMDEACRDFAPRGRAVPVVRAEGPSATAERERWRNAVARARGWL